MKRTLLLINLLLLSVCVFPQENIEVNYATIKKYVENQSDDYQQLIERFEANDSLLSLNDYALIYYGHSFTDQRKNLRVFFFKHTTSSVYIKRMPYLLPL